MVNNVVTTDRLIMRRFGYDREGNLISKEKRLEEVKRIFMSWSNPQNYRYNER